MAAREGCDLQFISDTMTYTGEKKVLQGEYAEVTLKNQTVVRLFKSNDGKIYLRLTVTENFYFDKVAMLEIRSGTKSLYAKNTRQHKISKTRGLFIIEVFSNYLDTLKDYGITGIAFGQAETDFTKQDARQVKMLAACMLDQITPKK
jgi:hypothetical protein